MAGPLQGFRVLDLSRILAGPWASQMLADLGAEVIKIERPGSGDDTRGWGPPYMPGESGEATSEAAYFHAANRGKQSVCIDMSQPEGQALIQDLARHCDVLIENFKVGGLKKYNLDYESLKELNPRLVYCSITGFGQSGPYADRAGYDFMIQAMGGMMSVTGDTDGLPMKIGVALADVLTGLYAANAIQAALIHQQKTGAGQYIDMALLDVQVATLANQAMNYLATGNNPIRLGNAHPNIVPYQAFQTSDGYIILAIGNDSQFQRFCELAGKPEFGVTLRPKRLAKVPGLNWSSGRSEKAVGVKVGGAWFGKGNDQSPMRQHNSRSSSRKHASAMIAKIPLPLARHIARVFKPAQESSP